MEAVTDTKTSRSLPPILLFNRVRRCTLSSTSMFHARTCLRRELLELFSLRGVVFITLGAHLPRVGGD